MKRNLILAAAMLLLCVGGARACDYSDLRLVLRQHGVARQPLLLLQQDDYGHRHRANGRALIVVPRQRRIVLRQPVLVLKQRHRPRRSINLGVFRFVY